MHKVLIAVAALAVVLSPITKAGNTDRDRITDLVVNAERGDSSAAAALRAAGPTGLAALMERNRAALDSYRTGAQATGNREPADDQTRRLIEVIDSVAAQRDAAWSGLYWFTDLRSAEDEAKRLGRPILSLRLLGRLTDELSCANSRFFRAALYADQKVAECLRDHFVLHWESERLVPIATIDFGDGRVIRQTITGNSIHYVLSSEGMVVDALPGLYTPDAFLAHLASALQAFTSGPVPSRFEATPVVARRHQDSELRKIVYFRTTYGLTPLAGEGERLAQVQREAARPPPAAQAVDRALSKTRAEARVVRDLGSFVAGPPRHDVVDWNALAVRRSGFSPVSDVLTPLVRAQIRASQPTASESDLVETMRQFSVSMAADTFMNELELRPRVLRWIHDGGGLAELQTLNARVYDELFLTPASDPWLGLLPDSTFRGVWTAPAEESRLVTSR